MSNEDHRITCVRKKCDIFCGSLKGVEREWTHGMKREGKVSYEATRCQRNTSAALVPNVG